MARRSHAVSPEKQQTHSDEEDVDANEGEWDFGPDDGDAEEANDGKLLHLGSDLPDIPADFGETQSSDNHAPVANMGNTNSTEEINDAIHATSEELRNRNGTYSSGGRSSTGKLNRPSRSANNPAYRNPVTATSAAQRKLVPTDNVRQSTYDEIGESPVKLSPALARWTEPRPAFSPRRTERRKAQQLSSPTSGAQQEDSSPRRSRRVQELKEQEAPAEAATPSGRKKQSNAKQKDTGAEISAEDATYKDFVPNHIVQNYQDEEAEAGAEDDEEGDTIEVAEQGSGAMDDSENKASSRKKVGRPRKSVKTDSSGQHKESTGPSEDATPQKRGVDRPKKSDGEPSASTEPKIAKKSQRKSMRGGPGQEEAGSSEAVVERPGRQTRAQKGASQSPQKAKPTPEPFSFKATDALRELQRRRTQDAEGDENEDIEQAQPNDANAGPESPDKDLFVPEGDERASPQRPIVSQQPVILSNSQVHFPEDRDEDEDEGEEEDEQPSSSNKRKRRAPKQSAMPNTSRKRQRLGNFEAEADEPTASASSGPGQHRICGQWRQLQTVFRNVELVGCNVNGGVVQDRNPIRLKDKDVKATVILCKKAKECYAHLKDNNGQTEAELNPIRVMREISERVDGLCGNNNAFPTDFEDSMKGTNIYYPLIPKMVELVKGAISCYETIDANEVEEGQIKISHLRTVKALIKMILNLAVAAKDYARPESNLRVIQPVQSGIAIPLRAIHTAFARYIQDYAYQVEERKRSEEEAAERALRLEQEERRNRQKAAIDQLRNKWKKLHEERMWAEGGIMSWKKRAYLQMPDDHVVELDQDGIPFERIEAFLPRVGPPPGLVDEAAAKEWSMVELSSLCDGLKHYAGPNVFERVFRKYCPQGRELNKFNVTEIVVIAAGLRGKLIESQKNVHGDVEDWIMAIPVWTKGHHALGKENEDGGVVDLTAG